MAKGGYIKLYRSIQDHWLWKGEKFSYGQAWIDLILLANHEEAKALYRGKLETFPAGTVNRSIAFLAERWDWDRKKVTKFLDLLESDGMVNTKRTTHGTTVSLVNYSDFQVSGTTNGTTTSPTDGQPLPTYKNNKNNKNNNIYNRPRQKTNAEIMEEAIALVTQRQAEEETEDEQ